MPFGAKKCTLRQQMYAETTFLEAKSFASTLLPHRKFEYFLTYIYLYFFSIINRGPLFSQNLHFLKKNSFSTSILHPETKFLRKILIDIYLKKMWSFRTSTKPPPILHLVKIARRARKIARRGKKISLRAIFFARRGNEGYQLNLL